jgi:hypothetical protein
LQALDRGLAAWHPLLLESAANMKFCVPVHYQSLYLLKHSASPQSMENILISIKLNLTTNRIPKLFSKKWKKVQNLIQNVPKQDSPQLRVMQLAALSNGIGCN